jgi:hypothetical protein
VGLRGTFGTAEQLAEKTDGKKAIPQRLKPGSFADPSAQLKLCPFKTERRG